jgi:DNA-binding MarR family transcriptional regulator
LVKVKVDINNRRIKRVTLTAAGVAKYAESRKLWRQAQDRFEMAFGAPPARQICARNSAPWTSDAFRGVAAIQPLTNFNAFKRILIDNTSRPFLPKTCA